MKKTSIMQHLIMMRQKKKENEKKIESYIGAFHLMKRRHIDDFEIKGSTNSANHRREENV